MKESDRRAAGKVGLMGLIHEGYAGQSPSAATFWIDQEVDATKWACSSIPRTVRRGGPDEAALRLGREVTMEQVGYRFESGVNGLSEVVFIYYHESATFSLRATATGGVDLSERWAPFADVICEMLMATYFREKGPSHEATLERSRELTRPCSRRVVHPFRCDRGR